jgi:hypothetical protein
MKRRTTRESLNSSPRAAKRWLSPFRSVVGREIEGMGPLNTSFTDDIV